MSGDMKARARRLSGSSTNSKAPDAVSRLVEPLMFIAILGGE